jgi:hypothetical protein
MKVVNSIIRVAIAVAIVNATARVGFAYWAYYQLRDHALQVAVFGAQTPPALLQAAVVEKAAELFLPVPEHQVSVTRTGPRTIIEANYVQPIEYFPSKSYPMKFAFSVEGFSMGPQGYAPPQN